MFDTVCIPEEMAHNEQDTTGTAGRPASQQLSDEASQACSIQARANVSPSMDTFGSASRSRAHTTPHESLFDRKSRMKSLSLNLGHDESSEYIFDNQRVPHSQQPRYSPGVDQFLALTEPPISRKYHREDRSSSSSPFTGQPHTPESSGSRNSFVERVLQSSSQNDQRQKDSASNASDMKSDPDSPIYCSPNGEAVHDTQPTQQEDEGVQFESDIDGSSVAGESEDDEELIPQSERYEALVIQDVGGNFGLAARLIPHLHTLWYQENSNMLGPWQSGCTQHGPNPGGSYNDSSSMRIFAAGNSGSGTGGNGPGNERGASQNDGQGEQQGDDNGHDEPPRPHKRARSIASKNKLLACHFHKKDPEKYNTFHTLEQGGKVPYRTCAGPGFTSIKRLREHFERTHLDVQCGRCARTFDGAQDKRAAELHAHRLEICPDNRPFVNEGVTLPQWVLIKDKTSGKKGGAKGASATDVEKWNEIWGVLYPGEDCPTPWFTSTPVTDFSLSSVEVQATEYRKCYWMVLNPQHTAEAPAQVNHEDVAIEAFKLWHTKVLAERGLTQLPVRGVVIPTDNPSAPAYGNNFAAQSVFTPMDLPSSHELTRPLSYPQATVSGFPYSSQQAQQTTTGEENYHARSSSAPEFQLNIQPTTFHSASNFSDLASALQTTQLDYFMQMPNFNASNAGQYPQNIPQNNSITQQGSNYDSGKPQEYPIASNAVDNQAYSSNGIVDMDMGHHTQMYAPSSNLPQQFPTENNGYPTWPKKDNPN